MKKFLIWLGMLVVGVLVFAVIGQFVGSYVFIRLAKAPVSPAFSFCGICIRILRGRAVEYGLCGNLKQGCFWPVRFPWFLS